MVLATGTHGGTIGSGVRPPFTLVILAVSQEFEGR